MKIGDDLFAVVDGEGTFTDEDRILVFADEGDANDERDESNRLIGDPNYLRVVPVTLLPTSEVARLRKREAEYVKLRKFVTALTEWDKHG